MDDNTRIPPADRRTRTRTRLVRAAHTLAGNTLRGIAGGAGTALGTWITWWLINH